MLSTLPLDSEPAVKPSNFAVCAGIVTEIIHLPAFWLLRTPLTSNKVLLRLGFFLTGYVDLVLLFALGLLVHRVISDINRGRRVG